jgi:hypothetical protein
MSQSSSILDPDAGDTSWSRLAQSPALAGGLMVTFTAICFVSAFGIGAYRQHIYGEDAVSARVSIEAAQATFGRSEVDADDAKYDLPFTDADLVLANLNAPDHASAAIAVDQVTNDIDGLTPNSSAALAVLHQLTANSSIASNTPPMVTATNADPE